jgi:asparagine synthase (glutamine-hydrolysing)
MQPDLLANTMRRMVDAIAHRGPDQQGVCLRDDGGVGVVRLAIVGGLDGMQPFADQEGSIIAACNGEIYNHAQLRELMESHGHVLRTGSDCEVLLHLYEVYGDSFVDRLCGQFALIVWDQVNRRVLVARDRFGICPLFYAMLPDRLLVASEIKAIFRGIASQPHLDVLGLAETALLYAPVPPRTCFVGVSQVLPASSCVFQLDRWRVTERRYWEWPLPSARDAAMGGTLTTDEVQGHADNTRELLALAVTRRLQGDVGFGVYLSGGVDSATICALTKRVTRRKFSTFSISFPDSRFDESRHQRVVADYIHAAHQTITVTNEQIRAALAAAVRHAEVPLFRTAPIPMYLLSGLVHATGTKYVLTGEGADELFCGYPIFDENTWDEDSPDYPRIFASHVSRWQRTQRLLDLFAPQFDPAALRDACLDELAAFLELGYTLSRLARAQQVEMATKLSGYLLAAQGDRVAMAHAVEQRFPFLDENVVAYVLSMPETMRHPSSGNKAILRRAAMGLLPESILTRPKQGYLAPDDAPFRIESSQTRRSACKASSGTQAATSVMRSAIGEDWLGRSPVLGTTQVRSAVDRLVSSGSSAEDQSAALFAVTTLLLGKLFGNVWSGRQDTPCSG